MGSVMTGIARNFQWVVAWFAPISGNVRGSADCAAKLLGKGLGNA
jgi:hypothetical protein